jgi:tetratricopeptide (TPR) repeat protein
MVDFKRKQPGAIEIRESLIQLGADLAPSHLIDHVSWMPKYLNGISLLHLFKFKGMYATFCSVVIFILNASSFNNLEALNEFERLNKDYPRNVFILLKLAECNMKDGNSLTAIDNFYKVNLYDNCEQFLNNLLQARQTDAFLMEGMDKYARAIQSDGRSTLLNRLTNDLTLVEPNRSETLVLK